VTLNITDDTITCDKAPDVIATRRRPGPGWTVSTYPDRVFDLNMATTAMTIADAIADNPTPDDPIWLHIQSWREELAMPSAWEEDEEPEIRLCVCAGEGCDKCENTGVIYP
jgi:hypothetical protein